MVTPLHKGGDKAELANYRSVSILPVISKVVEKVVAMQLMDHLNYGEHPLNPLQFGFRKHHSTETALCYFVEQLKAMLDKGVVVGAIFLDLKRAFDTVNHNILLSKLSTHNISDETLRWFKSYLENRKHCTRFKSTMSSFVDCSVGVPQGSILGPLLFSVYINDLPAICPEVHVQMYADDAVIYVHAKLSQEAAAVLQGAMENISDWMVQSCLTLNFSKTVSMFFSRRNTSHSAPGIIIKETRIHEAESVKYLGVVLDRTLSFKKRVSKLIKTVKFNLSQFRYIRPQMSTDAAKLYMHAMILSHFTYCITNWSLSTNSALEPLQSLYKQALKILDKKPVSYHYCNIVKKYGLLTFEIFILFSNVTLVNKIFHDLAPHPLRMFVKSCEEAGPRTTRASSRGDCYVNFRSSTFGQNCFSVKSAGMWNSLPLTVRESSTLQQFKFKLKKWLKDGQICDH